MPRATVSQEGVRKDLKSLPEGYVVLKRMSYGEFLDRRDMSGIMTIAGTKRQKAQDVMGEVAMANRKVATYEFGKCIIEHNLEDDKGNLIDFNSPLWQRILDPKIGDEIGTYIDELHQFTQDETLPNA